MSILKGMRLRNPIKALLVLGVGIVVGLSSGWYLNVRPDKSERSVIFINWASQRATGRTSGIRQNTNIASAFDPETQTFNYFSGAEFGVYNDELVSLARKASIPSQVAAESEVGDVSVRVWAFSDAETTDATRVASHVAQSIHLTTTEVWPAEPTSVLVDLYVLREGTVFSHGYRVDWTPGRPLRLAVFAFELNQFGTVPTHELAHILSGRWATGGNATGADSAGLFSLVFSEIAAELYANCGELLVSGELLRPLPASTIVNVNGRRITSPLTAGDVSFLLGLLRGAASVDQPPQAGVMIGHLLMPIPVIRSFGDQDRISVSSRQGRELLTLCRESSTNPFSLEQWFEQMLAAI